MDLGNKTYIAIKEKLISCEYPPGSMLNELQLAKEFDSSRTPVREAIKLLQSEGFVMVLPKKGIYVTEISLKTIIEIFQVRSEIEPLTLRLGAEDILADKDKLIEFKKLYENSATSELSYKYDEEMHLYLISQCKNSYIINMMNQIYDINARIIVASKKNREHINLAKEEHIEILNVLLKDDVEAASALMKNHIKNCYKNALDSFYNIGNI